MSYIINHNRLTLYGNNSEKERLQDCVDAICRFKNVKLKLIETAEYDGQFSVTYLMETL